MQYTQKLITHDHLVVHCRVCLGYMLCCVVEPMMVCTGVPGVTCVSAMSSFEDKT